VNILLLDIERSPALADVWELFNVNISLNQLREPPGLLCWAAKWLGAPREETYFRSDHIDGRAGMAVTAHQLLDQADAVVHWYGRRFDIPALNTEFVELGLRPPSPCQQIDLWQVVKRNFLFPSNKLDYVSRALGFSGKESTGGHQLWVDCMNGDEDAWERMEAYNKQDVWMLEEIYGRVQPWINQHPSYALKGDFVCPKCGSNQLQRRGTSRTLQSEYQRYQCLECGGWSRDVKRQNGAVLREVAA
jgi:predicted RNA-binding Zn-ribbon protein involved in translation (DUF1610 family)